MMGRIVKDPDVRRNEILDVAQQLFYTKGYEQTAVRDIISEIGIAKGTFYHHYNSKEELLDALLERMLTQSLTILSPIVADDNMPAIEKLHQFFTQAGNFKLENETFLRAIIPVWYQDSNAIMREKTKALSLKKIAPQLSIIIHQGIEEGVFHTDFPDEMGSVIMQTLQGLSDTLAKFIIKPDGEVTSWENVQRQIKVYDAAIASLLGAQPDSIHLIDIDQYRHWFEET